MTALREQKTTTSQFLGYKATKRLQELAKTPYDLTKEGNLNPERLEKFSAEACGYQLLYGTERIDKETMQALIALAEESKAIEKMQQMQAGAICNFISGFPCENRPALHTATRDFFENPQQSKEAKESTKKAKAEVDKLQKFITDIDKENKFDTIISIGIGGSELGPKAHYEALLHLQKKGRSVHFLGNIDPDAVDAILRNVDLKKSLVLVISKTGTTLETKANEDILREFFTEAGLKAENHFIAITSENSPLDNPKKYSHVFHIWDWVGGRFSTTSMVGGVLLAFAFGFDVYWEFLKGANAMDKCALNPKIESNLPLLAALFGIWNRNFLNHSLLAIIPYSYALARFPSHLQQLDMESNGKHVDKEGHFVDFETGPIIFGEPGTNAQHSFYQLIHQGTTVFPLEFIGFKRSQTSKKMVIEKTTSQEKLLANLLAQAIALALGQKNENPNKEFCGNRPSSILLGEQLTPFSLGALLAYYEHKVAFQGFIWNINSFDQEGVQLGKQLASKIIDRFIAINSHDKSKSSFPLGDALLKHLKSS